MGAVWEAEHVGIKRRVAVKLLQAQLTTNPEAIARFRREAQIAGSLGHDNICPVLDSGTTPDGGQFLVMDLLRGKNLAEVLHREGPLVPVRALDVLAQILDALSAAHAAGVVHRDLKPENVFLTRMADREDFARILDFGISKIVSDALGVSSMTQTGAVLGTPYYMAPEQARGQKDLDHRVDVYAAGVMLYEMTTGRLPYEGETFNELLIKIVTEPFPLPRAVHPALPHEVEAIIVRAMCRTRSDRYASAAEMRSEVLAARIAVRDRPADSPRLSQAATLPAGETPFAVSTGARSAPPARRRARLVVAAALAVLAIGGAALWVGLRPARIDAAAGTAGHPTWPASPGAPVGPVVQPVAQPVRAPDGGPSANAPAQGPAEPPALGAPPVGLEPPPREDAAAGRTASHASNSPTGATTAPTKLPPSKTAKRSTRTGRASGPGSSPTEGDDFARGPGQRPTLSDGDFAR
jgi:serine/threonine-protein kinase